MRNEIVFFAADDIHHGGDLRLAGRELSRLLQPKWEMHQ